MGTFSFQHLPDYHYTTTLLHYYTATLLHYYTTTSRMIVLITVLCVLGASLGYRDKCDDVAPEKFCKKWCHVPNIAENGCSKACALCDDIPKCADSTFFQCEKSKWMCKYWTVAHSICPETCGTCDQNI